MKRSAWRYLWKSEDIRKKLLFTLLLLVIYRFAANVPVPGVNRAAISSIMDSAAGAGNLLGMLDLLSGGTISNFSILAMGVYPYITAQIILQLLVPIIPALERKMKENQREGQKWMERWTVILTVPMALLSAIGQINIFNSMSTSIPLLDFTFGFTGASLLPTLTTLISMIAGTMFGIWIGQLISEFGIPNQGLSLIIFSGIVSQIPANIRSVLSDQQYWWLIFIILIILALVIFAIVYVQQGRRNVRVMFPGRRVGNRMSMPVTSSLPLMVNMAGMIPLIFASSILSFPAILAGFFLNVKEPTWLANLINGVYSLFGGGNGWYYLMYFLMVVAFTFFYTDVLFQQQNYGENLKKQGAQIPGVTVGSQTQKYLTRVQRRITLPGAFFLGAVAVFPFIVGGLLPVSARQAGTFLISSAGLLIVVGVVRDTFTIIETELKLHGYDESLIKG